MSRKPSAKTELRNVKRELRVRERLYAQLKKDHDIYRARATKAETTVKEWQERFDILLRREEKAEE